MPDPSLAASNQSARPAPLWRRLAAMVYDGLLLLGIAFVYGLLASLLDAKLLGGSGDLTEGLSGLVFQAGLVIVLVGFFVYFWHRAGQTLGMRSWRLLVVSQAGQRPSIRACLQRCAAALLSLLPAGLGYWWSLLDRENRTWHDRLSHTLVVVLPKPEKSAKQAAAKPE